MTRNSRLKLFCLSLGLAAAVGCSAKDDSVSGKLDEGEDPSESSENGGGGSNGGGSSRGGKDAGVSRMDAGDPDKPREIIDIGQPDATCAATSAEAPKSVVTTEKVVETTKDVINPVAIYLMLDRSSSMVGAGGGNPMSWAQATGAISAFVRDPASADIKVALGYFPPIVTYTDKSPTSPLCTGASCGTPTVAMRRAADNAASIVDSLNAAIPSADLFAAPLYTPTECGLRGLKQFCAAHRAANNNEKCVGVLITDGAPTECNTSLQPQPRDGGMPLPGLRDIAAANPEIPIFALGMTGADFNFLNGVAVAGGTDCTPPAAGAEACDVSSGQAAFLAALNAIREKVQVKESHVETHTETVETPLECEWKLPDPPEDMKFDKEKVNVTFSATGKDPMTLGRVPSEDECKKHPEGWRYDNEDEPKRVLACDKACEMIKTSPGAKISIEFGCAGKILE